MANFIEDSVEIPFDDDSEDEQESSSENDLRLNIAIVEFMKENELMYNKNHPKYKSSRIRKEKWIELSLILGMDVTRLQNRWEKIKHLIEQEDTIENLGNIQNFDFLNSKIGIGKSKPTSVEGAKIEKALIRFMRKNPFMYNSHLEEYKNIKAKKEKWIELSVQLDYPVIDLKRKWKILKDFFYKQDRKFNLLDKEAKNHKIRKWKHFSDLTFLRASKNENKIIPYEVPLSIEIQIINFVKKNSYLYDRDSSLYKSRTLKERAWEKLASKVDMPANIIKKKWKSLKITFHREDEKIQAKEIAYSKWPYFNELTFLREYKQREIMQKKYLDVEMQEKINEFLEIDSNEEIIEFMSENPFMHNKNSADYKNYKIKEKCWRTLANKLGLSVIEVKRKWKVLKDKFYREDNKISYFVSQGIEKPSYWKYYSDLMFLKDNSISFQENTNSSNDENLVDNCNDSIVIYEYEFEECESSDPLA